MAMDFGIHSGSESAPIHSLHTAGTSRHTQEKIIEARLRQIADYVDGMDSDSRLVWLKTGPHIYDREFDLSVKIEAMRWMLRIARRTNDSARDAIFQRLQNSIDQLEKSLEFSEWSSAT